MTTIREDAQTCDCTLGGAAYYRALVCRWKVEWWVRHGRWPTAVEMVDYAPRRPLGFIGRPDCPYCVGSGWIAPDGGVGVTSVSMIGSPVGVVPRSP